MFRLARASGGMADAHGSGPCVRKDVGVQLPPCPLTPDWGIPQPFQVAGSTFRAVDDTSHRPPSAAADEPQPSARRPAAAATADPADPRTDRSMPAGLHTARRTDALLAGIRAPYPGTDALSPRAAVEGDSDRGTGERLAPVVHLAGGQARGRRAAGLGGLGAVRLHAVGRTADTIALRLERCRPGTPLAARPEPEQDEVIAGLLRRMWIARRPGTPSDRWRPCAPSGRTSSPPR